MKLSEISTAVKNAIQAKLTAENVVGVNIEENVYDESALNHNTIVVNVEPIGTANNGESGSSFSLNCNINIFSTHTDFVASNRLSQLAYIAVVKMPRSAGFHPVVVQLPQIEVVFSDYTMTSIQFRCRYEFED